MNGDQLTAAIRTIITQITGWAKLLAALALACLVISTLAGLLGHSIPYVPSFKGSLQEAGIFTACLAYWLR